MIFKNLTYNIYSLKLNRLKSVHILYYKCNKLFYVEENEDSVILYNSENDEKLFVLNNLELSTQLFGKENVTVSFTCKKTNVSEVNDAKKFFMDNFGLNTNITFDYFDQGISKYYINS